MKSKSKLIEVALPMKAIDRESAREKSMRRGHPSTLRAGWGAMLKGPVSVRQHDRGGAGR